MPGPKKRPARGTNRPFSAAAAAPVGQSGPQTPGPQLPNYVPPRAAAAMPPPRRAATQKRRRRS